MSGRQALGAVSALAVVLAATGSVACARSERRARRVEPGPACVFAFLSHAGGRELVHLSRFGRRIDVLAPNWYTLRLPRGTLSGPSRRAPVLSRARRGGVAVWPVINARTHGARSIDTETVQRRVARAVDRLVVRQGYAGVTLDVEDLVPDQRESYTRLVHAVSIRLRRRHRGLAVYASGLSAAGGEGAYDWRALTEAADLLVASGFSAPPGNGSPGPQVLPDGFQSVVQHAATISTDRVAPTLNAGAYRRLAEQEDGSEAVLMRRDARASRTAGLQWIAVFTLGREPSAFWPRRRGRTGSCRRQGRASSLSLRRSAHRSAVHCGDRCAR